MTIFVVAVILALSIFFARRQAHKLAGATIQSAQGQIRLDEEHGEGGITYYVFVGKKKFAFSEDMSRVFREGEKYKVYYCKSGVYEMVLSLEQVEGSQKWLHIGTKNGKIKTGVRNAVKFIRIFAVYSCESIMNI